MILLTALLPGEQYFLQKPQPSHSLAASVPSASSSSVFSFLSDTSVLHQPNSPGVRLKHTCVRPSTRTLTGKFAEEAEDEAENWKQIRKIGIVTFSDWKKR